MTEGDASASKLLLAAAALAAAVLLVAAAASLTSASPWADSIDPDDTLEESPGFPDLSTGRLGQLVDAQSDGVEGVEADDGDSFSDEEVDQELEDAVRESVEDVDEGTVEEAVGSDDGSGEGSGDEGSQDAVDEATQQVEEDVDDEKQQEVDEETMERLVEQAMRDMAQEEQNGSGAGEDGSDGAGGGQTSSSSDGDDSTSGSQQANSTGDQTVDQQSSNGTSTGSSTQEGSDPSDGDLPGSGAAVLVAVAVAVLSLLAVAYRRDALSLEALRNLPRAITERASRAAFAAAELASDIASRIRDASTPLDAIKATVALLHLRFQGMLEGGARSTEEMASEIADGEAPAGESADSARRLVMDSWSVLTRASGLDSPDRRTPGQVARAAVERGLPAGPVRRVTDAFRDIEYGDGDPQVRAEEVRSAMKEIKDAAGGG